MYSARQVKGKMFSRVSCTFKHTLALTQIRDGVGVNVTVELNGPLEVGMGDPAIGQPEAFSLASLVGKLPEDLHGAGVHHLGEEGGCSWHWMENRGRECK